MTVRVGTSGYSYPEWKGHFYPEKFAAKLMLRYYAERFRVVEINNTFYRMPKEPLLESWAAEVPEDFSFVLKAPQRITHFQRLVESADSVAHLMRMASVLGRRLGPFLFQLPPNFKKDLSRLRDFLPLLPTAARVAFEFRHVSWFDDAVFEALRERNIALCIADTGKEGDAPFVATADWGYLRLRAVEYAEGDLELWAERVRTQTWNDAFVFFKHEEGATGPKLAKAFIEMCGA